MTTDLIGATVEITDDYSHGVNPPTTTRAVIRAIEIPSAGVRLVVMREDGTLRTLEGTGTFDTKVRVVAEEDVSAELAQLREQVRVLREALNGVMSAEDQLAMPDAHTEAAFNTARAALAATPAPAEDPIRRVVRLGLTESDEMVSALAALSPEDAEMFKKFCHGVVASAPRERAARIC